MLTNSAKVRVSMSTDPVGRVSLRYLKKVQHQRREEEVPGEDMDLAPGHMRHY